jgi:hypothetical protein
LDIYQQKRLKAKSICIRKKKECIERKIKGINETKRKKDTGYRTLTSTFCVIKS